MALPALPAKRSGLLAPESVSIALSLVLCLALAMPSYPTVFVRAGAPAGGDGLSWADAYTSTELQTALNAAAARALINGAVEEVWVASGVYVHSPGEIAMPSGVALYGGFAGNENPATFRVEQRAIADRPTTVTRGAQDARIFSMNGVTSATIDGLIVTGGKTGGNWTGGGAGIYINNCDASNLIAHCAIVGNTRLYAGTADVAGGGGIHIAGNSRISIHDCRIDDNVSSGVFSLGGGGVFVGDSASPTIENCSIRGNLAWGDGTWRAADGGGIHVASSGAQSFTGCEIANNRATNNGGGMYVAANTTTSTIAGCAFTSNSADGDYNASSYERGGGGIYFHNSCFWRLTKCPFDGNAARNASGRRGGAVQIFDAGKRLIEFEDCSLVSNKAWQAAGVGIYSSSEASFVNCLFAKNETYGSAQPGGGLWIFVAETSSPWTRAVCCDFVANKASNGSAIYVAGSAGHQLTVVNTIIADNVTTAGGFALVKGPSAASVTYSLFHANAPSDGYTAGQGNRLNADPKFANAAAGDYRLLPASLARDAGTSVPATLFPDHDLDGMPRPNPGAGVPDIGAYEYAPPSEIAVTPGALSFVQDINAGAAAQTATIDSVGTGALVLQDVMLSPTSDGAFSLGAPLPERFAQPGSSAFVMVRFDPAAPGLFHGVLHIESNAANETLTTVTLTGQGVASGSGADWLMYDRGGSFAK